MLRVPRLFKRLGITLLGKICNPKDVISPLSNSLGNLPLVELDKTNPSSVNFVHKCRALIN